MDEVAPYATPRHATPGSALCADVGSAKGCGWCKWGSLFQGALFISVGSADLQDLLDRRRYDAGRVFTSDRLGKN